MSTTLPYERAASTQRDVHTSNVCGIHMCMCTLPRLKHRLKLLSHPCSSFTSILYILLLLLFLVLSVFFFFLHPAPYGSFSLSFREELAYNIHKKVFRVSRCLVFSRESLKFLQCHRERLDSLRDSRQIPPLLIFFQGFRICWTNFVYRFKCFLLFMS